MHAFYQCSPVGCSISQFSLHFFITKYFRLFYREKKITRGKPFVAFLHLLQIMLNIFVRHRLYFLKCTNTHHWNTLVKKVRWYAYFVCMFRFLSLSLCYANWRWRPVFNFAQITTTTKIIMFCIQWVKNKTLLSADI